MTLAQYQNQQVVEKQMHHSVALNDQEYDAYYLTPDLLGVHIYAYPNYSYYLDNSNGRVMALKDSAGIKESFKSTVFRVPTEQIKQNFPDFKPTINN